MLTVEALDAGYGEAQILFGVDLTVAEGEVVTLLGRNGMGKTTTIRAIMGLIRPKAGRVTVAGRDLTGAAPFRIAQAGIGLVPEGRMIFPTLSVEENLIATAASRFGKPRWDIERIYGFFPRLKERRANRGNQLSGGEQQMLAIGRALMTNPRLIILDEATEGLAPIIRQEIWACLAALKREGESILVIDKNVDALAKIADRHIVLEKGRVVWRGTSDDLRSDAAVKDRFLHL
ncbi:MAG: ABC transporter ATP-binding protein [Beijerinckiaceae bacterium]|nr:ABC transporter ATP-binding protein [Beijerinckiaceae bacterium]